MLQLKQVVQEMQEKVLVLFEEGDCIVEGSQEFKLLSKAIFRASDTLGNQYQQKFNWKILF